MHKINLFLVLFLLLVTFNCCEKEYDNQIEEEKAMSCFKILDADSGNPIEGAKVSLWFTDCESGFAGSPSCMGREESNISDFSGNCCIEHEDRLIPRLSVHAATYITFCLGCEIASDSVPDTIYLEPAASIQFHIKNIPPHQYKSDIVTVSYPGVECSYNYVEWQDGPGYINLDYHGNIRCAGAFVDTTFVVDAIPGNNDLKWRPNYYSKGNYSIEKGILMKAHDTIFIEILY